MPATSTRSKLAYLAGLVDGEGSISVSYRRRGDYPARYARVALSIYNSYLPVLRWAQLEFGGSLHSYQRKAPWKLSGTLHFGDVASAKLIRRLLPYLIVKRAQAAVLLAFQATKMTAKRGRKNGVHVRTHAKRLRLLEQLRTLNKRGSTNASTVS